MQSLRARLQTLSLLTGKLIQEKQFKNIATKVRASGRFMIVREHGFYWAFTEPFPLEYYFSFSNETFYSRRSEQDNFEPANAGRWVHFLPSIVELDLSQLKYVFDVDYQKQDDQVLITLSPKMRSLKKRLQPIKIRLRTHVEHLFIKTTSGETTEWLFADVVENAGAIAPWIETLGLPISLLAQP